jgi:hypothetical protein
MRQFLIVALVIAILSGLAIAAGAQQTGQSGSTSQQPGTAGRMVTIECPPSAAPGSSAGTPAGSAAGKAATKRVEGKVSDVNSPDRKLTVANIELQVDPSSVVLVECKVATLGEVKEGATAKAAYEERNGQNVITVIETTIVGK